MTAHASPTLYEDTPPTFSQDWQDFQIITWQGGTPEALKALVAMGFTGAAVPAQRERPPETDYAARVDTRRAAGLRLYVENIATDFYSAYHRYLPGKPINARYLDVVRRYRENPADPTVFWRQPSLSDPAALAAITARLTATVNVFKADRPLYYSLGDEIGIADNTAQWDFDRSAPSIRQFRRELGNRYGSLADLNAEWGTHYRRFDEVVPQTNAEAIARPDLNFASWLDFRTFMDGQLSEAVLKGKWAVKAGDPTALAGIEGAQRPGPGGFDYVSLPMAVDLMEIYEDDANVDIARAMNPNLVVLTTQFADDDEAHRAVWRALLRGSRGLVVWDDAEAIVRPDGTLGPRGPAAAALYRELRSGIAAQVMAAHATYDDVAILYSPESERLQWLLDRRRTHDDWVAREADTENADTLQRASRHRIIEALRDRGITPRFVSPAQVESFGTVGPMQVVSTLVLPQSIVLADEAVEGIHGFASQPKAKVIADGAPGLFDGHGRARAQPPLMDITGANPSFDTTLPPFLDRVTATAPIRIEQDARVEIYKLQAGSSTILGMIRKNAVAGEEAVSLSFDKPVLIRDLRTGAVTQDSRALTVHLPDDGVSILAVSETSLNTPVLSGPKSVRAGDKVTLHLEGAPTRDRVVVLKSNVFGDGFAPHFLPGQNQTNVIIPASTHVGDYYFDAVDMLSGAESRLEFAVAP